MLSRCILVQYLSSRAAWPLCCLYQPPPELNILNQGKMKKHSILDLAEEFNIFRAFLYIKSCYMLLLQHNAHVQITHSLRLYCHISYLAYLCFSNYLFFYHSVISPCSAKSPQRYLQKVNWREVYQKQHKDSFVKREAWQKWPGKYLPRILKDLCSIAEKKEKHL